jgi:hypothetical protein
MLTASNRDSWFVEYVEPYGDTMDAVFHRISIETAIRLQHEYAASFDETYPSDREALYDFLVIHIGHIVEEPKVIPFEQWKNILL